MVYEIGYMMLRILLLLTMCFPFAVLAQTNTGSFDAKYKIGDCITPIDPLYSWYGKTGQIVDVVYSQKYGQVVYVMLIDGKTGLGGVTHFDVNSIDYSTAKLRYCPK